MVDGIISTIGRTPLVRLKRIYKDISFNLFAKLEQFNPGGSIKDRSAFNIMKHAWEAGIINSESVVIESTSGNMGIGLAIACTYYHLRFICVIDPKTTKTNVRLLQAYGVEVDMVTETDPLTGEYLPARINRVNELLRSMPNSFWPNQYANRNNSAAHHRTMGEVADELGRVDYLLCATSTCGTLRGCSEYVRKHGMRTKIYAVDAKGSAISGGKKMKRLIPGHGAALVPDLYAPGLADDFLLISDLDCVVGCHRLVLEEAILVGGSSGGVISALQQLMPEIPSGANCVVILADRGSRYLDTIYSESWVREHFGEVSHLWRPSMEVECGNVSRRLSIAR